MEPTLREVLEEAFHESKNSGLVSIVYIPTEEGVEAIHEMLNLAENPDGFLTYRSAPGFDPNTGQDGRLWTFEVEESKSPDKKVQILIVETDLCEEE
jgi:hypothetical protein